MEKEFIVVVHTLDEEETYTVSDEISGTRLFGELEVTIDGVQSVKNLRKTIKEYIIECFDEVLSETKVRVPYEVELELDGDTRELIAEDVVSAIIKELGGE